MRHTLQYSRWRYADTNNVHNRAMIDAVRMVAQVWEESQRLVGVFLFRVSATAR